MPRDHSPPAFLFYPDDFASDGKVEAMTTEGVGCYILLLCKAWRENPPATIPTDDRLLARWARVTDERWAAIRAEVLSPFEPCANDRLVQKRLRSEYEKQRRNAKQRSISGKLGAAARWQSHGTAIAKESESESEDESSFEDEFLEAWNLAQGNHKVKPPMNQERKRVLRVRAGEQVWRENWRAALAKFPLKCFADPSGWQPDVDWFLRPKTVTKILEGNYDWSKANGKPRTDTKPRAQRYIGE